MKSTIHVIADFLRKRKLIIQLIFLFSIILFVISQLAQILRGMTWSELKSLLFTQSYQTLLLFALGGCLAVIPLMFYDWVAVKILAEKGQSKTKPSEFIRSAWIVNTLNNFAGFGGVIGVTLRSKLYSKELRGKDVLTVVSKIAIFMLTGLSLFACVAGVDMLFIRPTHNFQNYWLWLLAGSLYTPLLIGLIILRRNKLFADFSIKRVIQLIVGSIGQWGSALLFFLFIGQRLNVAVNLIDVYPLFIAATLIGMITMVPGGMGTFDVLMIMGLTSLGLTKEVALVWLLFYRIFYYILPFLSGLALYIIHTGIRFNTFFDNLPKQLLEKTAHVIVVFLVYIAGILMVVLSTIPNLSHLSKIFASISSYSFTFLDQTLNMMVGFLLIGLARGVTNKVKKAYVPTTILLVFCIANTISKVRSIRLVVLYLFILICLYLSRRQFYRKQLVYSWEAIIFDSFLYGLLFIMYSVVGYLLNTDSTIAFMNFDFILFPSSDVWFKGLLGIAAATMILFLLYNYLVSNERLGVPYNEKRIRRILSQYPGTFYSHLSHLKDKNYYFFQKSRLDKMFFQFEQKANKLFVLGDPIGEKKYMRQAIIAFQREADYLGYELVFYGVGDVTILLLHDIGFDFIKIGEEGAVSLQAPNRMEVAEHSDLRTEVERLSSRGFTFTFYEQLPGEEILILLREIAKEWQSLNGRQYFSVGNYNEGYLDEAPIGIVRDEKQVIQGFISVKPIDEARIVSYDLMQYRSDAPQGIGAFMLVHLMEHYRRNELIEFSIGLTPFAKVGEHQQAFLFERMANLVYQYSYPEYSLKDVRMFKENFATSWKAQYLAYRNRNRLYMTALQLHIVITGSKIFSSKPFELLQNIYSESKRK